eukprot:TRINITY_DN4575_c0_g1_i1.p1 TRINITY_DN4575_c0_g1~~TRINITY_DN4575_c0_g1_i1.p1  ORF type:complete len:201 (+),score=-11.15 TRINITY_DN4575_c0_g1_i1:278-880(+)
MKTYYNTLAYARAKMKRTHSNIYSDNFLNYQNSKISQQTWGGKSTQLLDTKNLHFKDQITKLWKLIMHQTTKWFGCQRLSKSSHKSYTYILMKILPIYNEQHFFLTWKFVNNKVASPMLSSSNKQNQLQSKLHYMFCKQQNELVILYSNVLAAINFIFFILIEIQHQNNANYLIIFQYIVYIINAMLCKEFLHQFVIQPS